MRDEASGSRMSIGTPDARRTIGATRNPAPACAHAASEKLWRWSFGVGPYSSRRLVGSIGPLANGIWSSLA